MSAMKYQRDFLRFNKISQEAFGRIYIAFMNTKPTEADYRRFAGRWNIAILNDPNVPSDLQAMLCVNLNVIKVLAGSEAEALEAMQHIMEPLDSGGKADD